ncbi:sensor histidine kinase [Marinoscillum sp. MHG1-6]|uniref:sensor histidine kinase n=1 Tax=Marinoscillum sp. MHG1-6 TaxID=2959627 RepID=UPI0021575534|nr:sensor histidine kinase [Marinoscillum sp. MHG1-6]
MTRSLSLTLIFLIAAGFIWRVSLNDKQRIEGQIQENFEEQIMDQKADLLDFVDQFTIYSNPFDINSNARFLKRVFVNGTLVYWSDNELTPSYPQLRSKDELYKLSFDNGTYVARRHVVPSKNTLIEIYSLLPVNREPLIKNQYLRGTINSDIFMGYEVNVGEGDSYIKSTDFTVAYSLGEVSSGRVDAILLLLILISGLFLFYQKWSDWTDNLGEKVRLILGLVAIVLARFLILILTRYWLDISLFDPINYTSSLAHSLGDLLLNSLLIVIVLRLLYRQLINLIVRFNSLIAGILMLLVIQYCGFLVCKVSWNILENSLISLDVSERLQFSDQRVVAYLVLVVWSVIVFHVFQIGIYWINSVKANRWLLFVIHVIMLVVGWSLLSERVTFSIALAGLVWWILVLTRLSFDHFNLDYSSFLYSSLLIVLCASICSFTVYKHYEKDELVAKRRFANRLLIKNDFLAEYYLSQRVLNIQNDQYIKSRLSNRLLVRKNIREKIRRQHLSTYFDKYDIEVFLFDSEGKAMDNLSSSYEALWAEFAKEPFKTDYPNIYFVEGKKDNVQDRYYTFIPVSSLGREVGYVVLTLTLKKYIPTSVFPQLVVAGQYYLSENDRYDYAVFKEGKLLYKRSRIEFQNILGYPDLTNEQLFDKGIEKQGIQFYGLKTSDGRVYVIASPDYHVLAIVANFSFLYLVILFCMALLFWVFKAFDHERIFNLATKIQLYLGLSFVVPMLIVSVALLNSLNQSYKEEIDKNSNKKAYNISESLVDLLDRFYNNEINRDDLGNEVSRVASLIQSDVNIYSSQGQLLVSSEADIFELGLLSRQIAPRPFNAIKYGNAENKIYKQSIGELEFRVSFLGLKSYRNGELLGILSMPYFDSKSHLQRQQVEVFNNLISIFTIIFLFSLIIGNLIIDRLVKPLKLITEGLKTTNLQETNQPIEYHSADEVGILINEYNQMISKLEESKAALAESQKESAWKEIARQVAHEIKNPLTPMRLKIQQMMRHKGADSQDYKVLSSLIGQIDALSSIADSFSAFAKMPAPKNEQFDIAALIQEVADVHCSDDVLIDLSGVDQEVIVDADKKIFNGIFNNILLNAIQATSKNPVEVHIDLEVKPRKVLIAVKDNGEGISEESRDKIFTPYFSTKATGSGIGLAVAKKGIENAGGNIWFESKIGEGTTFFISMPVVV